MARTTRGRPHRETTEVMRRSRILTVAMVAALALLGGGAVWLAAGRTSGPDLALDRAIRTAGDFLASHCRCDGQFEYLVNLDPTLRCPPQYNIIRHAGAVYALAIDGQSRPSRAKREAMLRAAAFLRREAIAPVPGREGLVAVWSRPQLDEPGQPIQAKLGGAGLGLVALLSVEQIAPGTTPLEELQGLGRFILFLQEPDGGFYAKYYPSLGGRKCLNASLYYPGEAALGLLMLFEVDPQPAWLEGAARAIAFLAARRAGQDRVEADHWALLATGKLLAHYDQLDEPPLSREAILDHAAQICRSMLDERPDWPTDAIEHGCFTDDARTCPTATRVEGLVAALAFLPEREEPLRREIRQAVGDAVAFLVRAQVRAGPHAGGLARLIRPLPPDHPRYRPRNAGAMTEIRIDYVQHAMCGWIAYEAILRGQGA